jgi:hypothetical protein
MKEKAYCGSGKLYRRKAFFRKVKRIPNFSFYIYLASLQYDVIMVVLKSANIRRSCDLLLVIMGYNQAGWKRLTRGGGDGRK